MTNRYFCNTLVANNDENQKLEKLFLKVYDLYEIQFEKEKVDQTNISLYTGLSGHALLYIDMYVVLSNTKHKDSYIKEELGKRLNVNSENLSQKCIIKALDFIEKALVKYESCKVEHTKISFLNSYAGVFALGAVAFFLRNEFDKCILNINRLLEIGLKFIKEQKMENRPSDIPNEILYGKAGYLSALLYIWQQFYSENHKITSESQTNSGILDENMKLSIIALIKKISLIIINDGQIYLTFKKLHIPLMYEWHGKEYLGAAHGTFGILYVLLIVAKLHLLEDNEISLIKQSLDHLLKLQFPSGNFPSSGPIGSDKLVQWCHGAPGVIYTCLAAAEVFPHDNQHYMNAALKCGDVIWDRGLLTKGYGLCHGVAGNSYAFLALYNKTNELKYLDKAVQFGFWLKDYGKHGCGTPDRPASLYEGLAGVVYFCLDLMNPTMAQFPGYQINVD